MKTALKHITMVTCLAASANVCAEAWGLPHQNRWYSAVYDGSDGGPISVVIDGKTYQGFASRMDTGRAYVYQALVRAGDGQSLRCQLVDEGRRRSISGYCIDDNQKSFEVVVGRGDVRR